MNGLTLPISAFHLLFVRFQLPHSHHYLSEIALIKIEKYFLLPSTIDTFLSLPHLVSGQFLNLFRSPSWYYLLLQSHHLLVFFPSLWLLPLIFLPKVLFLSASKEHSFPRFHPYSTPSHGFSHHPGPDGSLIRILSPDLLHKLNLVYRLSPLRCLTEILLWFSH